MLRYKTVLYELSAPNNVTEKHNGYLPQFVRL